MAGKERIAVVLVGAVLLATFALSCGGSSPSRDLRAEGTAAAEGSATFVGKGPNAKLVKFGREASVEEREAASRVLEENLRARAEGDFASQCALLSKAGQKKVEETLSSFYEKKNCRKNLEAEAVPLFKTKAIRASTMTGPIDALRVMGSRGFALYHGTKGKDYAMSMAKEGDEWKVASVVTTEIP